MIIAILKAGKLEGKVRLPEIQREIDILLPVIMMSNFTTEPELTTTPRATFVWWRQLTKFTHEYRLKEVK